jgi:hypothetical protein
VLLKTLSHRSFRIRPPSPLHRKSHAPLSGYAFHLNRNPNPAFSPEIVALWSARRQPKQLTPTLGMSSLPGNLGMRSFPSITRSCGASHFRTAWPAVSLNIICKPFGTVQCPTGGSNRPALAQSSLSPILSPIRRLAPCARCTSETFGPIRAPYQVKLEYGYYLDCMEGLTAISLAGATSLIGS